MRISCSFDDFFLLTLKIIVDVEIGAPVNGEDAVDGINSIDKNHLREEKNIIKNITPNREGLGMIEYASNKTTISSVQQCKKFLI